MNINGQPHPMTGRSFVRCLWAALTALLLHVSVAQAQDELTILVPAEFPDLDTCEIISGDQVMVEYHVYSRLYTFNEQMEPVPDLVVRDEVSDDGLTWTFELQPDAVFHDGTPVTAEAVKYTVERMRDRDCGQQALFTSIRDITVESDTELTIVTHEPFPALRNNFAHPDSGIIHPVAAEELGDDFAQRPVGSGPYRLDEWITGSHLTLVRNDDYYGDAPDFERLLFSFVGDPTTRALMVDSDQADVALRPLPADVERLERNEDLSIISGIARNMYFGLNTARPPFDDQRVRVAANHAVDKEAIIERVLSGAGRPAHSFVEAVQFTVDAGYYEYDPELARSMLEEAGAVGAEVALLSSTGRYTQDVEVAQAVAGYLREVGLDVEIQAFSDWPSYIEAVTGRDLDMYIMGWGGTTGDPDNAFRRTIYGEIAGEPWNLGSYSNPEVDRLIEKGGSEFETSARAEAYAQAQQLAWDDAPWLFLYQATTFVVHSEEIEGIVVLPGIEMPYFFDASRQ